MCFSAKPIEIQFHSNRAPSFSKMPIKRENLTKEKTVNHPPVLNSLEIYKSPAKIGVFMIKR